MPRFSLARRKGLIGGLAAGMVVLLLVVVPALLSPNGDNSAQACDPFHFTDERLDQVFASRPGQDGQSWETAYQFLGNTTSGWTFWETTRYVIIQDCMFNDTAWGIRLWESAHVRVVNCTFGFCTRGIWAHRATDLGVEASSFVDNKAGIDLWRVTICTVRRNEFSANDAGILISSCSSGSAIYFNHFDAIASAANVSSLHVTFSGNFYADYFAVHPGASMDTDHPDLDYCSLALGAAFPLSEPVTWGGLVGSDPRPLWFVPNVVPSITILDPSPASCWRESPSLEVSLAGTVISNASYTIHGVTFPLPVPASPWGTGLTSVTVDPAVFTSLAQGEFMITVHATSWFNVTAPASVSCVKDTVTPVVTLVSPANGSSHALAPTITLTITDASACSATYTCGGTKLPAPLPTFSISAALWGGLAEGLVIVVIQVSDAATNTGEIMLLLLKDTTGPVMLANWTSGGTLSGITPPSFVASASDPAGLSGSLVCSVGSTTWLTPSGSVTAIPAGAYAALPDGAFSVTFRATDAVGNVAQVALAGTKDTKFDTFEILAPLVGAIVTPVAAPYFVLRAEDISGVILTWVSLDGGANRFPTTSIGYVPPSAWAAAVESGDTVTITFGATDAAGNNATASVQVNIARDDAGSGDKGNFGWWLSPFFWAGMTAGGFGIAIIVAITLGSIGRAEAKYSRRRESP